jgi:hypothetical protein
MQSLGAVCKQLHGILASPSDDQTLWGDITIRIGGPRRSSWPTKKDLDDIIPWLVQRAAGALVICRSSRADAPHEACDHLLQQSRSLEKRLILSGTCAVLQVSRP